MDINLEIGVVKVLENRIDGILDVRDSLPRMLPIVHKVTMRTEVGEGVLSNTSMGETL